ncbi:MAG: DUF3231 family protein [Clostridiales bacterium]|nr:DUF3231 family protein [Clostridiales bacterium]
MFPNIYGIKAEKTQKMLNVSEAYNLWDILSAKYMAFERIQLWENYAHDTDLKYFLGSVLKSMQKNVRSLEKEIEKYGLHGPEGQVSDVCSAVNSQALRDEYIAIDMFEFMQESIEMLLRVIRTSTTNDRLRDLFTGILKEAVEAADDYMKYLKFKGWVRTPPMYPNIPIGVEEKLDAGEAFHLWDHLTFRNDNIEQTQRYLAFANDGDFKVLLKKGLQDVLRDQADMLEKELKHFGLPLPVRPPRVSTKVENTNIMNDDNMFRHIFNGIQGAAIIHAQAFKSSVTNDRIRKIFKNLLYSEVKIQDRIIRFGKYKGWFNIVPEYITAR